MGKKYKVLHKNSNISLKARKKVAKGKKLCMVFFFLFCFLSSGQTYLFYVNNASYKNINATTFPLKLNVGDKRLLTESCRKAILLLITSSWDYISEHKLNPWVSNTHKPLVVFLPLNYFSPGKSPKFKSIGLTMISDKI